MKNNNTEIISQRNRECIGDTVKLKILYTIFLVYYLQRLEIMISITKKGKQNDKQQ